MTPDRIAELRNRAWSDPDLGYNRIGADYDEMLDDIERLGARLAELETAVVEMKATGWRDPADIPVGPRGRTVLVHHHSPAGRTTSFGWWDGPRFGWFVDREYEVLPGDVIAWRHMPDNPLPTPAARS